MGARVFCWRRIGQRREEIKIKKTTLIMTPRMIYDICSLLELPLSIALEKRRQSQVALRKKETEILLNIKFRIIRKESCR